MEVNLEMKACFNSCPRLVQVILLLIPVVNWIVEILVRGDEFLHTKGLIDLVMLILAVLSVGILGWVDLVWSLLFKHLIFAK